MEQPTQEQIDELIKVIDLFDESITKSLEAGELDNNYGLYFSKLEDFAKKHTNYHHQCLTKQQEITLSYFYSDSIEKNRKIAYEKYLERMRLYDRKFGLNTRY